jgi:hypothetical protein
MAAVVVAGTLDRKTASDLRLDHVGNCALEEHHYSARAFHSQGGMLCCQGLPLHFVPFFTKSGISEIREMVFWWLFVVP